jgi:hypothetical protein
MMNCFQTLLSDSTCAATPRHIIGMSSVGSCNSLLMQEGADSAFSKWDVGTWEGWARGRRE